jgi:hypothetical protein
MFLFSGIDTTAREVSIVASVCRPLKWLDLLDLQKDQCTILGYGKAYPYSFINNCIFGKTPRGKN